MKYQLWVAAAVLPWAMPALAQSLDTTTTSVVAVPVEDHDAADSGLTGTVALGSAYIPSYFGSSHYKVEPFGLVDLKYHGVEVNILGTTMKVNFGGDSHFEFGPVLGMSPSRSHSDTYGRAKLLDTISTSANVGGYAAYRLGGNENGQGRVLLSIMARQDVKSSRGLSVEPSIDYIAIRNRRLLLSFDLSAKINDAKYMRANFSVTPTEALRSGFAAYRPSGGISEISGGATAGYQFNHHWGLLGRVTGGDYLGDAGKSPIVKDGSKSYAEVAMGISYSF